jgi:glycosyltransferase involved in cell wall biosynthesis
VSVRAPGADASFLRDPGVDLRALPDVFGLGSMRALSGEWERLPSEAVVLMQYVPQGFGLRGANLPFAAWLGRRRQRVWLMVHEPFYPFIPGQPLRHDLLAGATRAMLWLAMRRAERGFVSTPVWENMIRPWVPNGLPLDWLPIPATMSQGRLSTASEPESERLTVAHFGTYGELVARPLASILVPLLERDPDLYLVLLGRGSERFRRELCALLPANETRIGASGAAEPEVISAELARAHVVLFPFAEGVSSRRTSLMSALSVGAAIVTTEGWCSEPHWRESGAVELVPTDAPMAAVDAVERLLGDAPRRGLLRRRASELYAERFHVERIAARLRELYAR